MKALFFDLDGTLLDEDKRIPDSAREALRAVRRRGVRVFLASGRSPRLEHTLGWGETEFSLFDGGVYSNGGYVRLGEQTRVVFTDAQVIRRCVDAVSAEKGIRLSLHTPGHGYTFSNFEPSAAMMAGWGIGPENLRPMDEDVMTHTAKMLVFTDDLIHSTRVLPESLCTRLEEICRGRARFYLTDQGRTVQIAPLEAGKAQAIRWVQEQLGLRTEEIAVFGDDLNDLEMFRAYPVSVAMGNAAPEIRAAARYVTRANTRDGIAWALENLLKLTD